MTGNSEHSKLYAGKKEPIAIIGIGCRFPGDANSPDAFWKLLRDGVDAITEVPADRWNLDAFYDPDPTEPGKTYTRWGGFIKQIDQFDARFFKISAREAARIDPQHRLLLEVAWEALEDAGQVQESLTGTDTGVFVGLMCHDYGDIQMSASDRLLSDAHTVGGAIMSLASNRISYTFDFTGPSITIDTACSSSLVAVHLACQSLWNQECTLALAGGANALLKPEMTIAISKASLLSSDGRCKSFDARADGYVRAEGAGIVVLKPLSNALADGDPIYAVIRASVVSQDGRKHGIGAPDSKAQETLLQKAYQQAGVLPEQVQYVEAHGTGTFAGDPIEANALGTVVGNNRPHGNDCIIGSVKSNIGHLEAAAGIAGLIKAALCLQHRQIPPSLHFQTPNPKILFQKLRLRVSQTLEPWPNNGKEPCIAGVNSFGFGGTNAHVVLEDVQTEATPTQNSKSNIQHPTSILPLSARSLEALRALAKSYLDFLSAEDPSASVSLSDICYTASLRRSHHDHRLALVANSKTEYAERLEAFLEGENLIGLSSGRLVPGKFHKLAFVCSGMGPQWWAMGRQLLEEEPVFREAIQQCDELLRLYASWSLWEELTASEERSRINNDVAIAQTANFALQISLATLWRSWGIVPDTIVGHSAGEVAAAHIAGVLSLEDALRVIFHRSYLQQQASGSGKMLAVGLSQDQADLVLVGCGKQISIAAVNSPNAVTLSGNAEILEEIAELLTSKEIFCRFLPLNIPFHSHKMDPIKAELVEALQGINPKPATIPLFSTVTGKPICGSEMDAAYWGENLRNPVLFAPAIDEIILAGYDLFLEISSHPVLTLSISECLKRVGREGVLLHSLRRKEPERSMILKSLGKLYTLGYPINWHHIYPAGGRCVRLPSYPWQRERYWKESEESQQARLGLANDSRKSLAEQQVHLLVKCSVTEKEEAITETADVHIETVSGINKLLATEPIFHYQLFESRIPLLVAKILGTTASKLDIEQPLIYLGLDSLMALELSNSIKQELNVDVSTMKLMKDTSIARLITDLVEQLTTPESVTRSTDSQETIPDTITEPATDWIVCLRPNPNASLRLFCFPYNAGSISVFRDWPDGLPSNIEVYGIQVPGGADRPSEQPLTHLSAVVETLAQVLLPYLNKPFAVYGHSLGALIGFELTRQLFQKHGLAPVHLFVGAWYAPHLPNPYPSSKQLSEPEFIKQVLPLVDCSESVLENAEIMRSLLPILKTGALLYEQYTYSEQKSLECPISAFGGVEDKVVNHDLLSAWHQHTRSAFTVQMFPGHHLFLHSDQSLILQAISQELMRLVILPKSSKG